MQQSWYKEGREEGGLLLGYSSSSYQAIMYRVVMGRWFTECWPADDGPALWYLNANLGQGRFAMHEWLICLELG
jgi:hypothetical protein